MDITLESTNAAKIARALSKGRSEAGSPAMDMALTMFQLHHPLRVRKQ